MAGDVFITKDKGWATSGLAFSACVVLARKHLERVDRTLADLVFKSVDHGMELIDLSELAAGDYGKVYAAIKENYDYAKQHKSFGFLDDKFYVGTLELCEELLAALASDPRAN